MIAGRLTETESQRFHCNEKVTKHEMPHSNDDDMQQVRVRGEAILTAIDESVIVLLKGLGSISFSLEGNSGDTL